jgi:hypothetical protein
MTDEGALRLILILRALVLDACARHLAELSMARIRSGTGHP